MNRSPEFAQPVVHYLGFDALPQLPGFPEIEVDDSIVLEGSEAYTGVRIMDGNEAKEFEIFRWPADQAYGREGEVLEVYPLDGTDESFDFEVQGRSVGEDDAAIASVVKLAFHQRSERLKLAGDKSLS